MSIPLAGGPPQQILEASWITNQQCARAPATLCVYSVISDGELRLFRFDPLEGKGAQVYQLQNSGKGAPVYQLKDVLPQAYNWSLSPDGTTLAFAKGKFGGEEPTIRLVSLRTGAEKVLPIPEPGVGSVDWAADGKSLWAASAGAPGNALLNIDLQGRIREVWRPKKLTAGWAIPSRDGRYLALHVGSTSANVWMLERP
jgi:Tol biopolymer transport system component